MWSGPRNISTAMMRAWENRPDTAVRDEPLYAHYLAVTGAPHPGAAEILAAEETDWSAVAGELVGPAPGGAEIYYQKHMAHHLLARGSSVDWLEGPASRPSSSATRAPCSLSLDQASSARPRACVDTGLPQQVEPVRRARRAPHRTGAGRGPGLPRPPRGTPKALLRRALHRARGLAFGPADALAGRARSARHRRHAGRSDLVRQRRVALDGLPAPYRPAKRRPVARSSRPSWRSAAAPLREASTPTRLTVT